MILKISFFKVILLTILFMRNTIYTEEINNDSIPDYDLGETDTPSNQLNLVETQNQKTTFATTTTTTTKLNNLSKTTIKSTTTTTIMTHLN